MKKTAEFLSLNSMTSSMFDGLKLLLKSPAKERMWSFIEF